MIPGKTIIHKCSECGNHIARRTTVSGNMSGARVWTDGFMEAPMFPDRPKLVKCRHCKALLWIFEQEKVGDIDPQNLTDEADHKFKDAVLVSTPTMKDYTGFLTNGVGDKQKERYVRLRVWWAGNDARRNFGEPELYVQLCAWKAARRKSLQSAPLDRFETENLRALTLLLDEDDDEERVMKAEAFRELGMFAEAETLLIKPINNDGLKQKATVIRELNHHQITVVEEIRFE